MLTDMKTKSEEEKSDEEVRFAAFKAFCAGSAAEKTRNIEEADSAIGKISGEIENLSLEVDQLDADIMKADSDIALLGKKIGQLAAEMTEFDNEMRAEEEERTEEHKDFEQRDGDYADSTDALDRAIGEMKTTGDSAGKAAALLQVASLKMVPGPVKKRIYSFLQKDPEAMLQSETAAGQPSGEAAGYEFQSDGIIDMFSKLDEKFQDEREGGQNLVILVLDR